ncbi:MAG: aldehyde dehydrogenase family protein [Microscillaceae bacterium]|nr:aldehyde dehydrogenase family protein [Microscillaceae bacterium]MDW8459801.1 aldehyde dehydrogenase family protein [Cytophagales bacterium]
MFTNTSYVDTQTAEQEARKIVELQKRNASIVKKTTAKERIAKLKRLKKVILDNRQAIHEAVYKDFRKPSAEADLGEIFGVLSSISHVCKHLRSWMQPKRVGTPLNLIGTSSKIVYEPKGVSLIISPWNYPFQLAIDPLVYAIAAGCTAVIKPSEMTPHTSALIKKLISQVFEPQEVAVLEGDATIAQALLKQPFDHIFFTGSPTLGKIVMRAAAEHLTSVTLELGGKSPVIIDEKANLQDAAEKIAWGKTFNCGQTCIAPDYALVHQSLEKPFIEALNQAIQKYYNPKNQGIEKSPDYPRIVNQRHFTRITQLLQDAFEKGAIATYGGTTIAEENYVEPTILTNVNNDMLVMQEEIFGPILPIIPYKNLGDALQFINQKPKPLALYAFSQNHHTLEYILQNTTAGGTTFNDVFLHVGHPSLPFGGVNNSGIGKTHGYYGFIAFSNERAVLKQHWVKSVFKAFYPPYTAKKLKNINLFSRYV